MYGVMIRLLTSRIGLAGLGIVVLVAILWGLAWKSGRDSIRDLQLRQNLEAWKNRNAIDHETQNLDDIDLCAALSGLRSDCAEKLRRLDRTPKAE